MLAASDLMHVDLSVLGAALLLLAFVAVALAMLIAQARDAIAKTVPSSAERTKAEQDLWSYYPAFPDDEPDSALFLLEQARAEYDGWTQSNSSLEGKATWLAGFLAAGAGLLTVLGGAQSEKSRIAPGPFLAVALIGAAAALAACLYIVRPKLRIHPSVSAYVTARIAFHAKARFHIALALAEEYGRATVALARSRRFDPVAWTIAQLSLALAIISILIHFSLHAGAPHTASVLQCRAQVGGFHGGSAVKMTCEEHERAR